MSRSSAGSELAGWWELVTVGTMQQELGPLTQPALAVKMQR